MTEMSKIRTQNEKRFPNFAEIDIDAFQKLKMNLKTQNSKLFQVVSGSMEPLIATGEFIEVKALRESPRRFDILVFWSDEILICHYLWHVNQIRFSNGEHILITRSLRGQEDIPFSESKLLGKVISHRISVCRKAQIVGRTLLHRLLG